MYVPSRTAIAGKPGGRIARPVEVITSTDEIAALAERLPDAVVVVDDRGHVCWGNQAAVRLMGRTREEWLGVSGLDLIHPDDIGLAALSLASVQGKEVGSPIELRVATRTGWILVELVGAPLGDRRVLLTMRDVTQRRRWEVAGDETVRFRTLVHYAAGLTLLLDPDGTLQSASGALTRHLRLDPELVCGQHLSAIVAQEDHEVLLVALADALRAAPGAATPAEVRLVQGDGQLVPFELSIVSLVDDPTVRGLVVSGHDITRLRAAQETLEQLATYDNLTGLLNRRVFDAALEREWRLTGRDGIDSYVIVCDLDHFKQLNDDHGHQAGDDALREFGFILRSLVRDTDLVARRGGDEFAVLLVRCGGELAAIGFADRLREAVAKRTWPGGVPLGVTLGHQSLRRSASPDDALQQADLAMLSRKPR
jgi:diguanylate cyclase (GGDEF)-like protein/PAS domain S-box-containing protein